MPCREALMTLSLRPHAHGLDDPPAYESTGDTITCQRRFTIPTDELPLLPSLDGGELTRDSAEKPTKSLIEEPTETAPLVFAAMDTVDMPVLDLSQVSRTDVVCPPRRWHRLVGPILIGAMLAGGGVGLYLLQFVRSF